MTLKMINISDVCRGIQVKCIFSVLILVARRSGSFILFSSFFLILFYDMIMNSVLLFGQEINNNFFIQLMSQRQRGK